MSRCFFVCLLVDDASGWGAAAVPRGSGGISRVCVTHTRVVLPAPRDPPRKPRVTHRAATPAGPGLPGKNGFASTSSAAWPLGKVVVSFLTFLPLSLPTPPPNPTLQRFTEKAIKVVMLAQEEARRLGHNFVGTEQVRHFPGELPLPETAGTTR